MKTKDELAEEHLLEELRKAPARMHQHLMTDFKAGYDAALESPISRIVVSDLQNLFDTARDVAKRLRSVRSGQNGAYSTYVIDENFLNLERALAPFQE